MIESNLLTKQEDFLPIKVFSSYVGVVIAGGYKGTHFSVKLVANLIVWVLVENGEVILSLFS